MIFVQLVAVDPSTGKGCIVVPIVDFAPVGVMAPGCAQKTAPHDPIAFGHRYRVVYRCSRTRCDIDDKLA